MARSPQPSPEERRSIWSIGWASMSLPASAAPPDLASSSTSALARAAFFERILSARVSSTSFLPCTQTSLRVKITVGQRCLIWLRTVRSVTSRSFNRLTHSLTSRAIYDQGNARYDHVNFQVDWFRRSKWHRWSNLVAAVDVTVCL